MKAAQLFDVRGLATIVTGAASGIGLAYAEVMARGRVSPSAIEEDWLLPRPGFDPAAVLGALARSKDVGATLAAPICWTAPHISMTPTNARTANTWRSAQLSRSFTPSYSGASVLPRRRCNRR